MEKDALMYFAGAKFSLEGFVKTLENVTNADGLVSIDLIKEISSGTIDELMKRVGMMEGGPELLEWISKMGAIDDVNKWKM